MDKRRNSKFKVLQPGISISSKYSTNGTLGLIVFDISNNYKPCILSNWHILAKKKVGSFKLGKPIYQPGRLINGRYKKNIVARLTRKDRKTDSAIAEIINHEFILNQYESDFILKGVRQPKKGDVVEKSGVRTGVTRGVITSVKNDWVVIKPEHPNNPNDLEISKSGDSGSVWYDPETLEGLVLHSVGDNDNSSAEKEFAGGWTLRKVMERLSFSLTDNT